MSSFAGLQAEEQYQILYCFFVSIHLNHIGVYAIIAFQRLKQAELNGFSSTLKWIVEKTGIVGFYLWNKVNWLIDWLTDEGWKHPKFAFVQWFELATHWHWCLRCHFPSDFVQVLGWIPRLRQRGDGRMSGGGGARLGISAPGVQEDAVLWKPVRHVLQPQQAPSSLGFPAGLRPPEWHQPGVLKGGRQPSFGQPAASVPSAAAAAAAAADPVLDINHRDEAGRLWIDGNCVFILLHDFTDFHSSSSSDSAVRFF